GRRHQRRPSRRAGGRERQTRREPAASSGCQRGRLRQAPAGAREGQVDQVVDDTYETAPPDSLAHQMRRPHVGVVVKVGKALLYLATVVALALVAVASASAHAASAAF